MNRTIVYPKWWLQSKTVLFNLLSLLILVAPYLSDFLTHLAGIPELQDQAKVLLGIVNVINIIIRFRTFLPISASRDTEPITVPKR